MFSGNLREATRSVHVSYPVPFLATLLVLAGLCLIGLARLFPGLLQLLLIVFGCLCITVALGLIIKAVFFDPALLRSEKYVFLDRMMAVLGDSDMDAASRERLQTRMIGSISQKDSEKPTRLPRAAGSDGAEGEGDKS